MGRLQLETKRKIDEDGERGKVLAIERVRDKIASNELSGPDVSLMRTAEIISTRDRNTRSAAIHSMCVSSPRLSGCCLGEIGARRGRDEEKTRPPSARLEKLEDFSPVISLFSRNTLARGCYILL